MSVPEIDVHELARRRADGALVVDVRQPDEYHEVRVPGAALMPLAEVPDRHGELPAEETVYVICRSGARSERAAAFLRQQGIDAVNVTGGTLAWVEAGHETDAGAPQG